MSLYFDSESLPWKLWMEERTFSNARLASPYSLEGMDVYSTVLYLFGTGADINRPFSLVVMVSTFKFFKSLKIGRTEGCSVYVFLLQFIYFFKHKCDRCAMGDCYSMQKDHENALKNFQQAVQLNSIFTYAHTLCGHGYEFHHNSLYLSINFSFGNLRMDFIFYYRYVAFQDFENGIKSYQNALKIDARHYNAWYGLAKKSFLMIHSLYVYTYTHTNSFIL
ncbi:putative tetratricopeptide-like helical domain superfamily [Helianthus anomalus]